MLYVDSEAKRFGSPKFFLLKHLNDDVVKRREIIVRPWADFGEGPKFGNANLFYYCLNFDVVERLGNMVRSSRQMFEQLLYEH